MLSTPVDYSENAKHKKVETDSPGDKQLFRFLSIKTTIHEEIRLWICDALPIQGVEER